MSEKTTEQLRDDAIASGIAESEYRREADRLRAILEETTTKLVAVTIERDELSRELSQVQGAERSVRRMVIRASIDGLSHLAVGDVRAALESGESI